MWILEVENWKGAMWVLKGVKWAKAKYTATRLLIHSSHHKGNEVMRMLRSHKHYGLSLVQ